MPNALLKSTDPSGIDPAAVPGALAAIDSLRDGWIELLATQIESGARAGWELLSGDVESSLAFDIVEDRAIAYAREQAALKVVGILETTRDQVQAVLAEAIEGGWSINKTAKALTALYSDFEIQRSITIARTEIAAAMNWGKHEAALATADRLGMQLEKEWSAVRDGRTRPTHAAVSGTKIKLTEKFSVGGYSASGPHDSGLPAEELINCRCLLKYSEVETENTEQ